MDRRVTWKKYIILISKGIPETTNLTSHIFVDIAIPTGMGHARNAIVVKSGKAVIAIAGAFGTLSEIGHALSDGNTVIGLHTWPLSEIKDGCMLTADNPQDAVELALKAAKGVA